MKKCFNCGKRLLFNRYAMSLYVGNVVGTDKIKPYSNLYFCKDCVYKRIEAVNFSAPSIFNDIPVHEVYIDLHKIIVECNKMEVL